MTYSLPTPPSSVSPTESLFAFHRSMSQQQSSPSFTKSHYRTYSSSHPTALITSPPSSPHYQDRPSTPSTEASLPIALSLPPKRHHTLLTSKLKKSARHLRHLFDSPAQSQPSSTPTSLSSTPTTIPEPSLSSTSSPLPDHLLSDRPLSSPCRPISSATSLPCPFDNQKDEYAPLPLRWRNRQLVHPYPDKATYLQSYSDAADIERYNLVLLQRINENGSPTFYPIDTPPRDILDLGAGACHWAAYAAHYWKDSNVVALDMVDVRCSSLTTPSNFKFVRGNFTRYNLPFPDESFDLVRMADLSSSISLLQWHHVLKECRRVLRYEGRLELIHDQPLFSYVGERPETPEFLRDARRTSYSSSETAADLISDSETLITEGDVVDVKKDSPLGLNRVERPEPPVLDDEPSLTDSETALLSPPQSPSITPTSNVVFPSIRDSSPADLQLESPPPPSWNERCESSKWIEDHYIKMLSTVYDIYSGRHLPLSQRLGKVFFEDNVEEPSVFNVHLASPQVVDALPGAVYTVSDVRKKRLSATTKRSSQPSDDEQLPYKLGVAPHHLPINRPGLESCPGIVVDIPTSLGDPVFLPMSALEVEHHACHHIHQLLATKTALGNYFADLKDDEGRPLVLESEFRDMIFEYEVFRRERFRWPATLPELAIGFDDDDVPSSSSSEDSHKSIQPTPESSAPIASTHRESASSSSSVIQPSLVFEPTKSILHPLQRLTPIRVIEVHQAWKRPPRLPKKFTG